MTPGIIVVLIITVLTVVLFITEPVPLDVTALVVLVVLAVLGRWTGISPSEALAGFSNTATITVLAMLILSEGVRRTGLLVRLADRLARAVGSNQRWQLVATMILGGPISAFMNNTPVVALLIPVVSDMARRGRTSPSRLLIPLSYVSMLGGVTTLIGTSTNILAADLSARILGHEIGMFEFTTLGCIVFAFGCLYLLVAAPKLLPERIPPEADRIATFSVEPYLSEARVPEGAPAAGMTVEEWLERTELDLEVLALSREAQVIEHPRRDLLRPGDVLLLHASKEQLQKVAARSHLELVETPTLTPDEILRSGEFDSISEIMIPRGSALEGMRLGQANFPRRFDAYVLAVRSQGRVLRDQLERVPLHDGDVLLLQTTQSGNERMERSPDLMVLRARGRADYRPQKTAIALAIVAAVVTLAAVGLVPIVISAIGGVVAMLATRVLRPSEMYQSVDWQVVFLLAGIIPLGMALEKSGAAAFLGHGLAATAHHLPAIAVLWLFYFTTGLLTEILSNNAAVLLMIPIAVATAKEIGAPPFSFLLAIMFAASTAFMGPVGYQTNLFVYGPGGYRVRDFVRIGAPLFLLLSFVTVAGIALLWGV